MNKHIQSIILCIFLIGGFGPALFAQSATVYPGDFWQYHSSWEKIGYENAMKKRIENYVRDSMNTTGLVVVVGGKILGTYGDIRELSYLASCRKSILAMLYGKYVEKGKIKLDKTLTQLKMDDRQGLMAIEKKATVRDLVQARSGIYHPASNPGDNSKDAPDRGSQEPGSYFLYNNWDFNAAGFAFEKMSGMNIYDALEQDLAIPIGMQDFDRQAQHKSGNLKISQYPAYHIWLSTRDMARLGLLMLRKGKWKNEQVVSEEWVKEITRLVTPVEEMNPVWMKDQYFGYGYMWWIWDGPKVKPAFEGAYTARGAYGQYITVIPKLDMVIAHKTNSKYRRSTNWGSYERLMDLIVAAKK